MKVADVEKFRHTLAHTLKDAFGHRCNITECEKTTYNDSYLQTRGLTTLYDTIEILTDDIELHLEIFDEAVWIFQDNPKEKRFDYKADLPFNSCSSKNAYMMRLGALIERYI